MRKVMIVVAAAVLTVCGVFALLAGHDKFAPSAGAVPSAGAATAVSSVAVIAGSPSAAAAPAKPALSTAQRNAVRAAQSYLELMGFSRTGLIKQLAHDGYSAADAAAALDSMGIDFMVQAERSAASYVDTMAFSRTGLIKQLAHDGYTAAQAAHGADKVGL